MLLNETIELSNPNTKVINKKKKTLSNITSRITTMGQRIGNKH